jgi:hypothetical protein
VKKNKDAHSQTHPELEAKMEELLRQSLHYNREMTRIHREIADLKARMRALDEQKAAVEAGVA